MSSCWAKWSSLPRLPWCGYYSALCIVEICDVGLFPLQFLAVVFRWRLLQNLGQFLALGGGAGDVFLVGRSGF